MHSLELKVVKQVGKGFAEVTKILENYVANTPGKKMISTSEYAKPLIPGTAMSFTGHLTVALGKAKEATEKHGESASQYGNEVLIEKCGFMSDDIQESRNAFSNWLTLNPDIWGNFGGWYYCCDDVQAFDLEDDRPTLKQVIAFLKPISRRCNEIYESKGSLRRHDIIAMFRYKKKMKELDEYDKKFDTMEKKMDEALRIIAEREKREKAA